MTSLSLGLRTQSRGTKKAHLAGVRASIFLIHGRFLLCFFPSPTLPVQLPQLLSHQPFRLGLPALLPFRPVMLRSHPLRCLRQQLLLQFVRPEKPTPPDRRPLLAAAFLPPRFKLPLEFAPPRRAVLGQPHLAEQPLHPQPRPAPRRRFEVFRVTAPGVVLQRLLRPQQFRPRRIQVHILAHRAEVARRCRIHHQRLVAPAEQMTEQLVPPVEPRRVGGPRTTSCPRPDSLRASRRPDENNSPSDRGHGSANPS